MPIKFLDGEPPGRRGIVLDDAEVEEVRNALRHEPGTWAQLEEDTSISKVSAWRDSLGDQYEVSQRISVRGKGPNGGHLYHVYARRKPLHEDTRIGNPPPSRRKQR